MIVRQRNSILYNYYTYNLSDLSKIFINSGTIIYRGIQKKKFNNNNEFSELKFVVSIYRIQSSLFA